MADSGASDDSHLQPTGSSPNPAERILERCGMFACSVDQQGITRWYNPTWTAALGYAATDLIGKPFTSLIHPDDLLGYQNAFQSLISHTKSQLNERTRLRRRDGTWQVIEWDWSYDPTIAQAHGLGLDITNYSSKQELLAQQQEVLSTASRLTDVGGWDLDLASMRMTWSGSLRDIFKTGIDWYPTLDLTLNLFAEGEARNTMRAAYEQALNHGTSWNMELPAQTCDGMPLWVHTRGEVQRRHGVAIRLVGAIQDITRTKSLEQRLAHAGSTLRELHEIISHPDRSQRQQFDDLLSLGLKNLQLTHASISHVEDDIWTALYAMSPPDEIRTGLSQPLADTYCESVMNYAALRAYHDLDGSAMSDQRCHQQQQLGCYIGAPLMSDHSPIGTLSFTSRGKRKAFSREDRDLVNLMAVWVSSLLNRERQHQALEKERDRAEAAAQAKSRFLAQMSHELRTPMNGVLGMTDVLLEGNLDADQHETVTVIKTSSAKLLHVIDDILNLTKIETGDIEITAEAFAIGSMVGDCLNIIRQSCLTKGIELGHDINADVPAWTIGDVSRIKQVLLNFLGNAVKFTNSGRIDLRVQQTAEGQIRFSVHDTGFGFDPAQVPHLFDAFTQADNSSTRRHDGTGLGLAIARELAMRMQGTVGAEGAPGKGAHFWLELPLKADPHHGSSAVQGPSANPTLSLPIVHTTKTFQAPNHVLIAEDNRVNQIVARKLVERLGVEITMVENGAEAVAALTSDPSIDAILMDCQMPEMDGFQATQAIRATGHTLPIIAVTANALRGDAQACFAAGMDAFLAKPISIPGLESLWAQLFRPENTTT